MIKKLLLLLLFSFLNFHSYSQITFEKAYYIDNTNKKVNCLIRNQDWIKTPREFQYKLTETDQPQTLTILQVKEFGFENDVKYQRYIVKIDRSSEIMRNMSYVKNPEFTEETLFLKVLVDGKASLYQYDENDLKRFFFKTDTIAINQLVYKSYKITESEIGHNNHYKQQLANALKDNSITEKNIKNLTYTKDKLVDFFSKYNHKVDPESAETKIEEKKDLFNLNIRAGITNSDITLQHRRMPLYDVDFGNKAQFRLGVEAEFILGFNKNKWALITEVNYQDYESKKAARNQDAYINYKSIELPFGVRHYSFLNNNSKLFFNIQYIIDFQLGSEIKYPPFGNFDIDSRVPFAFGLGYKFKDKYSVEFRYTTKKILKNTLIYSDYESTSLIFGYTLF